MIGKLKDLYYTVSDLQDIKKSDNSDVAFNDLIYLYAAFKTKTKY